MLPAEMLTPNALCCYENNDIARDRTCTCVEKKAQASGHSKYIEHDA